MEEMFERLENILQPVIPKNWQKIILYAEITGNSYDISFYCYLKGVEEAIQCYNLEEYGIKEECLDHAFEKIYFLLIPFWQECTKTKEWTNCTFSLFSNGERKFDLDYTDLIENAYKYREQWKAKYIFS